MIDPRTEKLADILVNYSVSVQPGDWVLVRGDVIALPLINKVIRKILQAGGHPTHLLGSDVILETELREASDDQLSWISPLEKQLINEIDVDIGLLATENTRALTGVDPDKQRLQRTSRRDLRQKYMQRSAEGNLRWVETQYPCPAFAQEADMSLSEFEDFVYGATFADQPDPIKCWQDVHDEQQILVDWLKDKKQAKVKGPNVDLSLSIEGRKFINSDGQRNMPSGEIFTGPVEDSANGWVKFTYPAIRGGREVEGVEMEFVDGKVVSAKAAKNEEYLISLLDSDPGARFLGEFAIGTNYGITRFTKSIIYDEKIGGTFHIAVGSGYPETGSLNQSSIHLDFICNLQEDSEIHVDGELFYKNGMFQI